MEKHGFFEDDQGNRSSSRLVMITSGVSMGLGCSAILFAVAWSIFKGGGLAGAPAILIAAAGPVCAMAGVAYSVAKTRPGAAANEGGDQ